MESAAKGDSGVGGCLVESILPAELCSLEDLRRTTPTGGATISSRSEASSALSLAGRSKAKKTNLFVGCHSLILILSNFYHIQQSWERPWERPWFGASLATTEH